MGGHRLKNIFTSEFWAGVYREASVHALQSVLQILLILAIFCVTRIILFRAITKTMAIAAARGEATGKTGAAARARTLDGLLRSVLSYVLFFVASFMILGVLGLDKVMAPVLTAAGVVGLAVGFGAQKLVKDVISGFFLLLEDQYAVGEYVTIGTTSGVVEELAMRTTRVRDEVGRLTTISNGDITIVTNHSRGPLLTSIEVGVAPGADLDKVCAILRELGANYSRDKNGVLGPFTCDGIAAMDSAKVTLRLVGHVKPDAQQQVQLDLRKRVRDVLMENDIQIA